MSPDTLVSSAAEAEATSKAPINIGRADVREFLRMLNRRKWQLFGVAALVCVVTAAVLVQFTPEYRATALVMLDTRKAKVTNTTDVLGGLSVDIPAVQTEIEVLKSANLLGRVVDKLHLERDPEYGTVSRGMFSSAISIVRTSAPITASLRNLRGSCRSMPIHL